MIFMIFHYWVVIQLITPNVAVGFVHQPLAISWIVGATPIPDC
jgi:hypothetical protein